MLSANDFNKDPIDCAKFLLGKVIKVRQGIHWLSVIIIETEAYYLTDKASHASLGYTKKRSGLFMPPGTIYMYYARGGDSLNISCRGEGNAVLIKSGYPCHNNSPAAIKIMQQLNPHKNLNYPRIPSRLCSGQTLLCKSMGLKVVDWDQKNFDLEKFYIDHSSYIPKSIIQSRRLGIPKGRDEHLMYRFIHSDYADYCTQNPQKKKNYIEGIDFVTLNF